MITCTKCGVEKEESEFYRNGVRLRPDCKQCVKTRTKRWYDTHPDQARAAQHAWYTRHIEQIAEYSSKYYHSHKERHKANWRKWYWKNRDSVKAYREANAYRWPSQQPAAVAKRGTLWAARHPEAALARYGRYRRNHPEKVWFHARARRARKLDAQGCHTYAQWLEVKAAHGFRCLACGRTEPDIKLTQDHVLPLSRGGSDSIDNIQPLCFGCNARKHTQHIDYR